MLKRKCFPAEKRSRENEKQYKGDLKMMKAKK